MKFILTLLAAVGFAAALPEPVAGGGGGYHDKPTTKCYHTSTCKAVYHTRQHEYTKPVYVDVTTTVYKPVTKVTEVPSTYYKTKYRKSSPDYLLHLLRRWNGSISMVLVCFDHSSISKAGGVPPPAVGQHTMG